MIYKRKIVDTIIKYLELEEIIVLHGARQVGKTHILYWLKDYLAEQNKDVFYIDLEDSRNRRVLDLGVAEFIDLLREEGHAPSQDKKTYVFIDEIQYLKSPSEFLKLTADHHKNIKLIVSGSSSFEIKSKFKDSLVGRTVNFEIFNLSFEEFLLFRDYHYEPKLKATKKKIEELKLMYKEYVLFGGYPRIALTPSVEIKEKRLQQTIDTYISKDIRDLANIEDPDSFNRLLEILAAQSGQQVNIFGRAFPLSAH
jgi:predicted AAA+ superfamily ATPase